jgi:hypothetical protein
VAEERSTLSCGHVVCVSVGESLTSKTKVLNRRKGGTYDLDIYRLI